MQSPKPSDIRNVALVGHHGSGKTTLAEALLAVTGTIPRQGSVDKGTTVCDVEPEAVSRTMSLSLAIAPFSLDGVKVNLLDAPGYADFSSEMEAAIAAADLAVVVVNAVDGIQAQTEDAWRMAAAAGLPRIVVVNKLDRERADFDRVLAEIQETFGAGVAPVELPIGSAGDFRGVIDLLDDQATIYDCTAEPPLVGVEGAIPDTLATIEHDVHERLVEGIVVADDALTARYLDGDAISKAELEVALGVGMEAGTVHPVLCCSALTGVGIDRLARLLVELAPSPDKRPPAEVTAGDTSVSVPCDPSGATLALVVKTLSDTHTGRISLCRVLSGTIRPDAVLVNSRTRSEERLHALFTLRGHTQDPVEAASAGDFVAVGRLNGTLTGDTLAAKGSPVEATFPTPSTPDLSVAVVPASRTDEDKLMSALGKLCEEDCGLSVSRDDETRQTVMGVAGEMHFAVTVERLQRRFGVTVSREDLLVPYRETITQAADAEGRLKKQSGGHGQYAVCHLRVEPLDRGVGFEFHDAVVGGAIPRQYIPAVEKGVREVLEKGGVFGHPVVDVSVTVDDGKFHSVDSSEMAFKAAAASAFRDALAAAGPVTLEPVSEVTVSVPFALQGDVLADLHARRGRVVGTNAEEDDRVSIVAMVPLAELARYAVDLRSITGGRGRFRAHHDHYEPRPE